ncbi:hypothetical protein [Actinomadura madurae]|uniref:hypothetical protein n=1 Tax=Actinomadura madurae TaxID=1993 RepID=UPI003D6A1573
MRKELAWLGFGPLAPSTYVCPHDRVQQVVESFAEPVARLDTLRCRGPTAAGWRPAARGT